jgi:hypothetical protein
MSYEEAVEAVRDAARAVEELRDSVDLGHVPMIRYLTQLVQHLQGDALELEFRCQKESGE